MRSTGKTVTESSKLRSAQLVRLWMKKLQTLSSSFFLLSLFSPCFADSSGASNVTYTVPPVSILTVSGNVAFGTFATPAAGSDFSSLTDNSTTYNVTNNAGSSSRKVTVQLGAALPTGISLSTSLNAPAGATSTGTTAVSSTSAVLVVAAIGNGAFPGNGITYNILATVATAAVASATLALTYTLTSS